MSSSKLSNLQVVLGNPELATGVTSKGGFGDPQILQLVSEVRGDLWIAP